ncbi:solute carrier family 25 0 [Trichuris trichiura]|uniref:Solute carrier family 25 0 n=1 Tax=Trichuris trichiura TaxID=36087 RepID=A0A077ZKU2_TRITR|nr:solute carrier family 25 0 [Trichuris trichiura]
MRSLSVVANPLDVVKVRLQKQATRKSCVTPLDVVKVRLQAQRSPTPYSRCFIVSSGLMDHLCTFCGFPGGGAAVSRFNGTMDAFFKISRHEGIGALWSGLTPALAMAVPATVCYFTLYDNLLSHLHRRFGHAFWVPMIAGSSARGKRLKCLFLFIDLLYFLVVSATLISPLEMARTKLQSKSMRFFGAVVCFYVNVQQRSLCLDVVGALNSMIRHNGLKSLYLGLGPTLLRDVPFSAIYWTSVELLKSEVLSRLDKRDTNFAISLCIGAFSGAVSAVCTLPFDVVKTHRQIQLGDMDAFGQKHVSFSTWRSLASLWKQHGIQSLFTGIVPRLVKVAPACAIMIATYDYGKLMFERRNVSGSSWLGLL